MVSFFRQKYFEKGVPIWKPVQNIPTHIIHSHPLLLILLFHPPKWHPRILTQPTYPYFTECSHLPVFLPKECRYLVWISGFPPLDCQLMKSIPYKNVLSFYLQFTQITSSSRSEETHAQESPKMLLQVQHWNTTGKICSVFNLSTAVMSASTSEFTAIFFWKISSWYLM